MNYWQECTEEAITDAGIKATGEQVMAVASSIDACHKVYSESTGLGITHTNCIAIGEKELAFYKSKVRVCDRCGGEGSLPDLDSLGIRICNSCNGAGITVKQEG